MFEFKLPDLGEGIHEGELLKWHVAKGDTVKEDDPLCDMETDKAAVTIPCPRTGTIHTLKGEPGDIIHVGDVFVVIDDGSRASAILDGQDTVVSEDPPAPEPLPEKKTAAQPTAGSPSGVKVIAAPATRRLAREMGIDIHQVKGTGPGGRVTPEDLAAWSPGGGEKTPEKTNAQGAEVSVANPIFAGDASGIPFLEVTALPVVDGPVEKIPMRSLRKKTAVKTTSSAILIPHVAHMDEMDVTEIESLRRAYNEKGADKLTLLAFVIKAVTAKLRDFPMFNASVDHEAGQIIHKKFYNIGFAADTPRGLMVPVIHDADRISLAAMGHRLKHLAQKARQGQIEVGELTGGTFTITNVGAIGGTHVFPIINAPESAILGLGRVEKKPVVRKDEICIRKILPVTLSFDHRVADGAQAASFVSEVKKILESQLNFMARV